jgi:hypothetical protein
MNNLPFNDQYEEEREAEEIINEVEPEEPDTI